MKPRGKGRARGVVRGPEQEVRPGSSQPQQDPNRPRPAPVPQGARGRPLPQGPAPQAPVGPSAWVRPQMPTVPTAPVGGGRGSRQGGAEPEGGIIVEQQRVLQGGAEAVAQDRGRGGGNGGVRGRTNRNETIQTRPQSMQKKTGTSGRPIELTANYFALLQSGKWGLNQYRVDFNPDIDDMGQRKGLVRTAMQGVVAGYLFDGTVLYTPQRINPDPLEKFVRAESGENIKIAVRLVGDVVWGDYHYIQLFNLIIRKCLAYMKFQLVQRDYYDPSSKISVPEHKMELWPGYYTSIRQHEQSILLNCEVKFKMMRMDTVYDMLLECQGPNARKEFQSKIIGSVVLTFYNNKTYKIDDVDFHTTPASTFPLRDGTTISFKDYYKQKYNITIKFDSQPMLVSRSKAREIRAGMPETILLIPELCQLTGLTDRQRENFHLMRALANHTRLNATQRTKQIMAFSHRMRQSPEAMAELRRWDLSIADALVKIAGRVLRPEVIISGGEMKHNPQNADWTRDIRAAPMCSVGNMRKMAILCPGKFKASCQDFVQCMQRVAQGFKWNMGPPKIFDIPDDRSHTYLDNMDNIIQKNSPDMIMCVVPNSSQDRYSAIKKKGCVDRGVPTQVLLAKNLSPKGGPMSIATKVVIQLNCKVGGAPWTVVMPLANLMVVGYDVCRDTANRGKSFGAMVASLDRQVTRYYSYTCQHSMEEELSDNFAAFLLVACQRYKSLNGQYPEKIIIYRDGVGDGQLPYVHQHEVANIKKKLSEEIYTAEGSLKLAFVVVSKRINTRIFAGNNNPPPGTVVDDIITLPERYDFFIVSQCVHQGTVAPTNYNVIEDTLGLSPDHMQILTYKLCHMYYNWSGTVRVPAPCQYAHKLAFLVAQSLHRPANSALDSVLYYL